MRHKLGLLIVALGKRLTKTGYKVAGIVTASEIADIGYSSVTLIANDSYEQTFTDIIHTGNEVIEYNQW